MTLETLKASRDKQKEGVKTFLNKNYPYILQDYRLEDLDISKEGIIDLGFITLNTKVTLL